jgi:hypothetical protein
MDEIINYKMCAVKVRNAKLRNYLNVLTALNRYAQVCIGTCAYKQLMLTFVDYVIVCILT